MFFWLPELPTHKKYSMRVIIIIKKKSRKSKRKWGTENCWRFVYNGITNLKNNNHGGKCNITKQIYLLHDHANFMAIYLFYHNYPHKNYNRIVFIPEWCNIKNKVVYLRANKRMLCYLFLHKVESLVYAQVFIHSRAFIQSFRWLWKWMKCYSSHMISVHVPIITVTGSPAAMFC